MAPHHPLAAAPEPIADEVLIRHLMVAVADSAQQRANTLTFGLFSGQDVLTVSTMRAKLEAQLRGLGCGFMPEPIVRPYIEHGRLVARVLHRPSRRTIRLGYAWRHAGPHGAGRALQWWLGQLESPATRAALLERHSAA